MLLRRASRRAGGDKDGNTGNRPHTKTPGEYFKGTEMIRGADFI
jgi:hypothetical protein